MDKQLLGKSSLTVLEAMSLIDKNATGILFLVDDNEAILGCVTDGDIRRFILSGGDVTAKVMEATNKAPVLAHSEKEARGLYHSRNYIAIPIVNDNKQVLDVYLGDTKEKRTTRSIVNIPVVINAGGKGTRLDPFTRVLPKPLIPVGDLPIIEHIMKEYQSYGCDRFHMIVNYKRELIKSYFFDNENNYDISWYDEDEPLGTGGGLSLLRGKLKETFFFANCDVLLKTDYESIVEFHKTNKNIITMICAYKSFDIPYGVVEVEEGRVKAMKEKPQVSFLVNTGIYVVEPEVIEDMEDGVSIGFPDVIEMERKKGRRVAVFPISENDWMDMGQLPELEKMRAKMFGE